MADKYKIINIRRYIGNDNPELGEDALFQILSEFSCPMNPNVERFLKKSSIEFAKKNQSVTYLVFSAIGGKLQTWLLDRHYDAYNSEIEKIDVSKGDVLQEICRVLEITYLGAEGDINLSQIELKNKKIAKIKQYTDSREVLDNLDCVAMNQAEFETLLKNEKGIIYLYGTEFNCPAQIENVVIEGINNPVVVIHTETLVDFEAKNVRFRNVVFDKKYQQLMEQHQQELEHKNDKKNIAYQPSSLFDIRLSDDDRKKSQRLYALLQKELVDVTFDVDVHTKKFEKLLLDADLYDAFDIDVIGKKQRDCLKNAQLDDAFYKFCNRIEI